MQNSKKLRRLKAVLNSMTIIYLRDGNESYLAANLAEVSAVLTHFHLLDLLPKTGTISCTFAKAQNQKIQIENSVNIYVRDISLLCS